MIRPNATRPLLVASCAALLCAGLACAQSVYRWVDANGRVQYSDQPPPANAKDVQQRSMAGSSIQNNELPLLTADAQRKNPVTLYVSECGPACDGARDYLNKRGIPHTQVDPTRNLDLNKKFKDETGGEVVPVLRVGEKRLSGWSEASWAAALDAAGYPRTPAFAKPKPVVVGQDQPKKEGTPPAAPVEPGGTPPPAKKAS